MGILIFINIMNALGVFAVVKAVYDIIMKLREERRFKEVHNDNPRSK
jgi:hypothetical protein